MLEYLPWSKAVLDESLAEYKRGKFTMLDIELGGECNFTCIYCDSPDRNRPCTISIKTIEFFLKSKQIKWIHICGIGEPTGGRNYSILLKILHLCEKYTVKCNMFSNIFNLTDELIEYVKKGVLYVLFKTDTLSNTHAAYIYGIDRGKAQKQIENIKKLTRFVKLNEGRTNLAASLVPTSINEPIIAKLIQEQVFDKGIFPMIGDLENSGRGREHFEALKLNEVRLKALKNKINSIVGTDYVVPQCPAVISSIHISAENEIIVDEFTGLSCNWFWLEEPKLKSLITLSKGTSIEKINKTVMDYRTSRLPMVREWLEQYNNIVTFGGCGGNVRTLLEVYLCAHEGVLKNGNIS